MNTPKHIRKLNDLLRTELGEAKGRYAWLWSESKELLRPMRVIYDDGTPVFNYRTLPTKWQKDHPNQSTKPKGITIAEPVYTARKTAIDAQDQWLMCILLPPSLTPHQWDQVFGTSHPYPANGEWAPCDPIRIPRGQEPTEFDTWTFIDAMRRQRKISAATWDNEMRDNLDRKDVGRKGEILDMIKDAAPAFLNVPGMKGQVSFPTVQPSNSGELCK